MKCECEKDVHLDGCPNEADMKWRTDSGTFRVCRQCDEDHRPTKYMTPLAIVEATNEAERVLKTVHERRPKRKTGHDKPGREKCSICKMRIRGSKANHDAGDHHQRALKGAV